MNCQTTADLHLWETMSARLQLLNIAVARGTRSERTKTFLKQHPLEKHMLSIAPLIPNADLLVHGPESRFDGIYRSHAVGREADTRSAT